MAENASQSIENPWASWGLERPPDPWPLVSSGFSFGTSQIQACIRPCHPYIQKTLVAIRSAVVYYVQAAHAFSAEINVGTVLFMLVPPGEPGGGGGGGHLGI